MLQQPQGLPQLRPESTGDAQERGAGLGSCPRRAARSAPTMFRNLEIDVFLDFSRHGVLHRLRRLVRAAPAVHDDQRQRSPSFNSSSLPRRGWWSSHPIETSKSVRAGMRAREPSSAPIDSRILPEGRLESYIHDARRICTRLEVPSAPFSAICDFSGHVSETKPNGWEGEVVGSAESNAGMV